MTARDNRGRFVGGNGFNPLVMSVLVDSMVANATYGLPRGGTATTAGDPRRDIDVECGFPGRGEVVSLEELYDMFDRCSIAARVVELDSRESWSVSPTVYEDEDSDAVTDFEQALDDVAKTLQGESWFECGDDGLGNPIWNTLQQADELSGIGQYGVVLLGLKGDDDLSQPASGINEDGTTAGKAGNELIYLRAYDQTKVTISEWETDRSNPRCGMPRMYEVQVAGWENSNEGLRSNTSMERVHWSRVIHVADTYHRAVSSNVMAVSRMRPVWNELLSCRKISGASGEFYWNHGSRDLIIESHPQLGGKVRYPSNMLAEMEKFQTGLQRSLRLSGASAKTLNPAVSDPTPHLMIQVKLICIKKGVPERIFWGSERGELASSQDERGWARRMMGRQNGYVTPRIIVPFINRCIQLGVLPQPKEYYASWPSMLEMSPQEQATVASSRMEAMAKYVGGNVYQILAPVDLLTRELGYTQEEATQVLETAEEYAEEHEPEMPEEPATGEEYPTAGRPAEQPPQVEEEGDEQEEDEIDAA